MYRKIWLINLILATACLFFISQAIGIWSQPIDIPDSGKPGGLSVQSPGIVFRPNRMPPVSEYQTIALKNLFVPDRKEYIPPPVEPEPEPEPEPEITEVKISGEKVVLYGVILRKTSRIAIINNPIRGEKADTAPYLWVEPGDRVSNLNVTKIEKDRILLADESRTYAVLLYDGDKPRETVKRQVIKPADKKEAPRIVSTGPDKKSPPLDHSEHSGTRRNAVTTEGEYEIIDTPFGIIKRRISR